MVCLVCVYETLKSEKEEADEEYSSLNQWCFFMSVHSFGSSGSCESRIHL